MGVDERDLGAEQVAGVPGAAKDELPAPSVVDETGSTNDDVMELGRAGEPAGTAVAAHEQTLGRGRRGHIWGSPEGGLYLSVLLRPQVPMHYLMGLSAVCALGALDALHELGATKAELKWPNDVIVPERGGVVGAVRKLAGILVEAGTGEAGVFAVCGIGVNLAAPHIDMGSMGSARPLSAAGLAEAMGEGEAGEPLETPGFEELARALRDHIVARVDAWEAAVRGGRGAAGPLAPILSEYFDHIPLLGHEAEAVLPDGRACARGTFCGLDVWGRAELRLADGREVDFASEQASLRAPE
ncbi:biotin--[acetyl-CoA-carboxylase] ligase [uncultured Parolsenella sp.]|uniref:biotin--[acetyl-CoA-carboxylase] ligase n=1 Tax=uncultured Parolsenella sp. TaxID=2083008 RepID=UPI0025F0A8E8|nr:biotin--[acetyl-CoA-carboxylase] ligase [uncultured Parolsenella sp.]